MVKVIETHITLDDKGKYNSFQSRVIEVESWESYVNEIKSVESVTRTAIIGHLTGVSLPRNTVVEELKYDKNSLSCYFYDALRNKILKLAYLIRE
jgi:hypothetical protein